MLEVTGCTVVSDCVVVVFDAVDKPGVVGITTPIAALKLLF